MHAIPQQCSISSGKYSAGKRRLIHSNDKKLPVDRNSILLIELKPKLLPQDYTRCIQNTLYWLIAANTAKAMDWAIMKQIVILKPTCFRCLIRNSNKNLPNF